MVKFAFFCVCVQVCGAKAFEHLLNVDVMLGLRAGEYEDVVEVDDTEDIDVVSKSVLDKCLEGRRGIRKTERHDEIFVQAEQCAKGCFPLISILDTYEVEGVRGKYVCGLDQKYRVRSYGSQRWESLIF